MQTDKRISSKRLDRPGKHNKKHQEIPNPRGHVAVTQHKAQQSDKDKGRDVDNNETLVKNFRTGTGNHDRKSEDTKNGVETGQ